HHSPFTSYGVALMRLTTAILAYILLTTAIFRSTGLFEPVSLILVLLSLLATLAGNRAGGPHRWGPPGKVVGLLLSLLVARELFWLATTAPSVYRGGGAVPLPVQLAVLVLGLLTVSYAWQERSWGRWRFPAVLAVYLMLGGGLIHFYWPTPGIDVW